MLYYIASCLRSFPIWLHIQSCIWRIYFSPKRLTLSEVYDVTTKKTTLQHVPA
jgi:hypothetical protein